MTQVAAPTTMLVITNPIIVPISYAESSSRGPSRRFNPIDFMIRPFIPLRISHKRLTCDCAWIR
jgi:hypothetical protein